MGLLGEVIASSDKIEADLLMQEIPQLVLGIDDVQRKVMEFLTKTYKTFVEKSQKRELLESTFEKIMQDYSEIKSTFQNSPKRGYTDKIELYRIQLENVAVSIRLVSRIFDIHNGLLKVRSLELHVDIYTELRRIIEQAKVIPESGRTDAVLHLIMTVQREFSGFLLKANRICKANFICMQSEASGCLVSTIKVKPRNEAMKQALLVLSKHAVVTNPLNEIKKFLLEHILMPAVLKDSKVEIKEVDNMHVLELQVCGLCKNSYEEVFDKISLILDFLCANVEYELSNESSVLSCVGEEIRDDLSELLVRNCLNATIPSTIEGLEQYQPIADKVDILQQKLVESRIFATECKSLTDYTNNINLQFIESKCLRYMSTATAIMKKDLQLCVEVGTPYNPSDFTSFTFLKCSISKSSIEFMALAEKVMDEAIASSNVCAGCLYHTVEDMFEMYAIKVFGFHEKTLQSIPQQVALYHNNCLYLSHELLQWSKIYKGKLDPSLYADEATFRNLARNLEAFGKDNLIAYLQEQVMQIEDVMSKPSLFEVKSLENFNPQIETFVLQCMQQQKILSDAWHLILAYPHYNRSVGFILKSLCDYLIKAISSMKLISSSAAMQLVKVLKIVLDMGPKLFSDPQQINLYVKNWQKFEKLVCILGMSLFEINDWRADGKAPIASQFALHEICSLTAALFPNSDNALTCDKN